MRPRHAVFAGMRGLVLALAMLAAAPAGAESDHEAGDAEQPPGAPDVASPGHEAPASPGHEAPAPPATPPAAPRTAPTTQAPAHATVPPGNPEAPKVLGRQFPAPVQPPPPAENPEVHVTVVPPSEPRVGRSRLRQGGGEGFQDTGQDGDDAGFGDNDGGGDGDGELD